MNHITEGDFSVKAVRIWLCQYAVLTESLKKYVLSTTLEGFTNMASREKAEVRRVIAERDVYRTTVENYPKLTSPDLTWQRSLKKKLSAGD